MNAANLVRGLTAVLALCGLFAGAALTGCGGDSKPTSVQASDLDENGEFWTSLTPDLKDELVGYGKERLGAERPDGAAGIRAFATGDLVAEVDKQYSNESKRGASIYETYTGANDALARANLDSALSQLDQSQQP